VTCKTGRDHRERGTTRRFRVTGLANGTRTRARLRPRTPTERVPRRVAPAPHGHQDELLRASATGNGHDQARSSAAADRLAASPPRASIALTGDPASPPAQLARRRFVPARPLRFRPRRVHARIDDHDDGHVPTPCRAARSTGNTADVRESPPELVHPALRPRRRHMTSPFPMAASATTTSRRTARSSTREVRAWAAAVQASPALDTWMLALLGALLLCFGMRRLR